MKNPFKTTALCALMCATMTSHFLSPSLSTEDAEASPVLKEGEHYLTYNVWFEQPTRLYSINYKKGTML